MRSRTPDKTRSHKLQSIKDSWNKESPSPHNDLKEREKKGREERGRI